MSTSTKQDKATKEDSERVDEYHGGYKSEAETASEEEQWGLSQNPVKNDAPPWKNLKTAGG